MTKYAGYSYVCSTRNWPRGSVGMAYDTNRERRALQDHRDELDQERRAALASADQRLIAIARAETDRGIQADLWDVLQYCGYPVEGPTTVD